MTSTDSIVKPFSVTIADETIDTIKARVDSFPWHEMPDDGGWGYGTNLDYMREFCSYWVNEFDWRKQDHKQETDHANSVFFVSGPRSLEWRHRSGHLAPSCVQRLYQGHLYNRWARNRWGIDYTTTGASSSLDQQRFITSDLTRDANHRVMRAIRHNTP